MSELVVFVIEVPAATPENVQHIANGIRTTLETSLVWDRVKVTICEKDTADRVLRILEPGRP